MKSSFNRQERKENTQRSQESYKNNRNSKIVIQFALASEVEIPALRVCYGINSTDCHAPLAMTDCNEKRDLKGNALQMAGRSK